MPSDANARTFQRFDELVEFLRRWRSWSDADPHEYDVGSMLRLLGACADNLKKFALDAELEDIAETLEPEQLELLMKLGRIIERSGGSNGERS